MLQKLKAFWERKGYEPNPHADVIWAQAKNSETEFGTDSSGSNSITFPDDIIEEMKKAKREVEMFEKTLQSFKEKITI